MTYDNWDFSFIMITYDPDSWANQIGTLFLLKNIDCLQTLPMQQHGS